MKKKTQKVNKYTKEIENILDNFDFIKVYKENILDNFDFIKVYKVMDSLNWTWVKGDTRYFPDILELKKCAKQLLEQASSEGMKAKEDFFVSTGGFTAEFFYLKETKLLKLSFVIEEWETRF